MAERVKMLKPDKPTNLDTLAERLHKNLGHRTKSNRYEWVAIKLEIAGDLFKARKEFKSNAAFSDWLMDKNLHNSISKDDRAALIGLGEHLNTARDVLDSNPEMWSIRSCWAVVNKGLPSSQPAKTVAKNAQSASKAHRKQSPLHSGKDHEDDERPDRSAAPPPLKTDAERLVDVLAELKDVAEMFPDIASAVALAGNSLDADDVAETAAWMNNFADRYVARNEAADEEEDDQDDDHQNTTRLYQ